jgi:Endonuclease IV
MVRFGPAGNSDSFTAMGYKTSGQVPEYLAKMGLDAFEYQCGRGVRIAEQKARELGELAAARGISLSLHAPYYISLSSVEQETRLKSIDYILQSARAVDWMGGNRIVVHSGSCAKITRDQALALALDTLQKAQQALDAAGYSHIHICPETMGKVAQLGTLEEVLTLCSVDERLIPCVDFGHLNARTFGESRSYEQLSAVFDLMAEKLGAARAKTLHIHFSKIEYTDKGGEKRHLTFADTQYGPEFDPVARLLRERQCSATVICESAGTQAEDAAQMMRIYRQG